MMQKLNDLSNHNHSLLFTRTICRKMTLILNYLDAKHPAIRPRRRSIRDVSFLISQAVFNE